MDLSNFRLQSFTDPKWMQDYIAQMGESKFWHYRNEVYKLLLKMKVGESLSVQHWCKPENFDIFIKISCCFISETKCCYQFNPEFTIIKRNFDAREVETILTLLRTKRRNKESGTDGPGTGSGIQGTLPIPPSQSSLQGQY